MANGTVRVQYFLMFDADTLTLAEFVENKDNCTKQALRLWLSKLETLLDYMKTFKDQGSVDDIQERLEQLYGFMAVMGMDTTGKTVKCELIYDTN